MKTRSARIQDIQRPHHDDGRREWWTASRLVESNESSRDRRWPAAGGDRRVQADGCVVKDLDIGLIDFPRCSAARKLSLLETRTRPAIEFGTAWRRFRGRKPSIRISATIMREPPIVMPHETEIKLPCRMSGGAPLLRAAGFRIFRRRVFEANTVFDTPKAALRPARRAAGGLGRIENRIGFEYAPPRDAKARRPQEAAAPSHPARKV